MQNPVHDHVIIEPDGLLCPITHEMFRDPVIMKVNNSSLGHTFEREAIYMVMGPEKQLLPSL